MKIPKFKPPTKSEYSGSYLTIIGLMLAVFILALIGIVSQGATVHAVSATTEYPYSFELSYTYVQASDGYPYRTYNTKINSVFPIYGYESGGNWNFALVDFENDEYYVLTSANTDDYVNGLYYLERAMQGGCNDDEESIDGYLFSDMSYQIFRDNGGISHSVQRVGISSWDSTLQLCTATVFESSDALKAFIETGELVGVIHEGEVTIDGRDFGGEYDPDVPIPQLKSLSYNGFTVANAADNLELDLVVKSSFFGYELKSGIESGFYRDEDWPIGTVSYDCTANSDIGYTKSTYNLYEDFGCTNAVDLANYGVDFFKEYPSISDLPTYDYWKFGHTSLSKQYALIQSYFNSSFTEDMYATANAKLINSTQAVTKYYVRFYELEESSTGYTMNPGQWFCYTYYIGDNGSDVIISPVEGDGDGKPVETDPEQGGQDEDGNIVINPPIDYSGDSLLEIITGILGDLTEMIAAFQDFASFLTEGLSFIPENIWTLIRIGFGLSVCFLVWRFVVK